MLATRSHLVFLAVLGLSVAAVAPLLWQARSQDAAEARLVESLYMEARFSPRPPGDEPTVRSSRGWIAAKDRWRWEVTYIDAAGKTYDRIEVSDGRTVTHYDGVGDTFYRQSIGDYWSTRRVAKGLPNLPVSDSLLGPIGNGDVDGFLSGLRRGYRTEGQDSVLGRPVEVLVLEGNDAALWLWVDRKLGLSLRYEARVGAAFVGGVQDAITRLEVELDVEKRIFEYRPPDHAREVEPPRAGP